MKELEALNDLLNMELLIIPRNKDKKAVDFEIIQRGLKALEIIKYKNVDICGIKKTKNVHEYNVKFPTTMNEFLEEQEYDLLKEVLK